MKDLKGGEITEEDVGDPNLKGRKSAGKHLERNVIRNKGVAREIQDRALDFSDFQQTGLYDEEGLFERVVDFQRTMPLIPQFLSPLFGKVIAEILFGSYVSSMYHHGPTPPTFLGLGAGRGYLDFDIIDHITGELFAVMNQVEYPEFGEAVVKSSRFIVSDRTNRAVRYLQESLGPLVVERKLQDRVEVRQVNATDFRLERKPFGIVYSNELLDALAVEPIVDICGALYKVKVVPYTRMNRPSDQIWTPGTELEGFEGKALTKDGAMVLLRGDKTKVRYCPVFIPLSYDPELEERARSTRSLGRAINSPDFGGLYPLQLKVGALLDSAKASFDHDLVLFVDYASHREGQHNWNVTVNHFRHYVFGEEDVDFQVDFNQVVEEGERRGFRPIYFETQKELLKQSYGLVQVFTDRDYQRWGQVNRDIPKNGNVATACLGAYTMCFTLIPHDAYKVLILQF